MSFFTDNILAIIAAAIGAFAFGALYYGLLGRPWMTAAGLTEEDIKGPNGKPSPVPFIISFLCGLWMATILTGALLLAAAQAAPLTTSLATSFIVWMGFVLPVMMVNHRYQMQPWSLTLIDSGHWLGVLLIQALILRLIGLNAA